MDKLMRDIRDPYATVPPSWSSASIADARAFRIGEGETVHAPSHVWPTKVRGECGVMATTSPYPETMRYATWADAFPTCPTCKAR